MKKIAILCLLALLPLLPAFHQGPLAYTDSATRMAESQWFLEGVSEGWISSWSYDDYAGMPSHLYQYQVGFWILGLLQWLLGLIIGYKVFLVIVYAFVGLSVYYFLDQVFPKGAFTGAALFILQTQVLNRILEGVWAELIGLGFVLLLARSVLQGKNKLLIPSILFALTILSHLYAAMAAVVLLCCIAYVYQNTKVLWVIPVGAGLTVFYWYPFFETSNWLVPYSGSSTFLFKLKQWFYLLGKSGGGILRTALVSIPSLIVAGLALVGWRSTRWIKTILLFSGIMLLLSLGLWQFMDNTLVSSLIPERFLLYVRIGLITLAASTLARFDWEPTPELLVLVFVLLPVALPAAWFGTVPTDIMGTWSFVNNAEGRVLLDDTSGQTSGNLMPLAHAYSNFEAIGGFTHNPRMPISDVIDFSGNRWFGKENISRQEFSRLLNLFNIQYVISSRPPPVGDLVYASGTYRVYTVPFADSMVEGQAKIISVSPKSIVVDASGPAVLKYQYHPYWSTDKGTLTSGELGLMTLQSEGITTLTYTPYNINLLYVSAFFLLGILFYSVGRSSKRWDL
ncbi:MAG: hypothetical protein QF486_01870 [Candidatus Woesearchaeota archaeon]|jgi:hypothetical protein|nr:hypothetical protein [Candidatus Woesearchaeota archaeon]MDP7181039.1 hypothetical protein [Candidatus Woesearchaeota archaeon]MDP7198340.1 hypothetical protein [Candidatus Woesearchaeota archaeon]MDP7467442.1 hypothetical protein [Candidatus Woesearchaeota archaeon]MDP7647669.1 hypothetical protein [Candidatus Woesearchaeota archaeon]